MHSINEAQITLDEFPTAAELRELTATPEELFEKQVTDTATNIMTTMVRLAKEQGRSDYAVQVRKDNSSEEFINAILSHFEKLEYTVSAKDEMGGLGEAQVPVKLITISWAAQ